MPMHAGVRDYSIDGASMMLWAGTGVLLGTQDLCMPVLEANLRLVEFTQESFDAVKALSCVTLAYVLLPDKLQG